MTTLPFESFIQLVRFDQEIRRLNAAIEREQKALKPLQEQKEAYVNELAALRQFVHETQKRVDAAELDMKTLEEREATIKHKIESLTNPKEYSGLKKELDTILKEQHDLEDSLIEVWNQLENAQRTLTQKQQTIDEKIEEVEQAYQKKQEKIEQFKQELQDKRQSRPEKKTGIPEEWLEKYEMMQGRVDDPVVEIVQGSCGGCFYQVPNQELLRAKRRALLQCKSCYRFMYDPEVLQQDQSTEEAA